MGSDKSKNRHEDNASVKLNRKIAKKQFSQPKSKQLHKAGTKVLPKILIIADDEKSIILYLKGFNKENRVRNLEFSKEGGGLDQLSLAEKAKDKITDYDCIFCIFDQDASHKSDSHYKKYVAALSLLEACDNIEAITSIPCYEIWLLLHFKFTDKPCGNTENKSICDKVISELKKCDGMQDYDKADKNIYQKTGRLYLDNAIRHAELLEESNERGNTNNPSTNIHLLMEYLQIYSF
jgi:hypothetical protein